MRIKLIVFWFILGALLASFGYVTFMINQKVEVELLKNTTLSQNKAIKELALNKKDIEAHNNSATQIYEDFYQNYQSSINSIAYLLDSPFAKEEACIYHLKEVENAINVFFANPPS